MGRAVPIRLRDRHADRLHRFAKNLCGRGVQVIAGAWLTIAAAIQTMRMTVPLQVAKCGGDRVAVPNRLKMQLFKEGRCSRCAFRPKDGL